MQNFAKNRKKIKKIVNFCEFLQNFATFSKNQLDSFVDLEKPEKMRIWLQNFVSIQPRTSLEKSDVSSDAASGPLWVGQLREKQSQTLGGRFLARYACLSCMNYRLSFGKHEI